MSITVADVIRLPCMNGAEVVAGHKGLRKAVDTVTVLEYGAQTELLAKLFQDYNFNGSEIIISALANIADDVEAQCQNVRLYQAVGSVGLILYYVGMILPEIDSRLIDVCNELDFPLICMSKEYTKHSYSEAITEITFEIYRDRQREQYFVSGILERLSDLPPHQQNMQSLLRMLSDHLQSSVFLIDIRDDMINVASWPHSFITNLNDSINNWIKEIGDKHTIPININNETFQFYKCPLLGRETNHLKLYLLSVNDTITSDILWQSSELIQLFIHIWGPSNGKLVPTELIHAILADESLRMEKLAKLFRIDLGILDQMWIISSNKGVEESYVLQECNEFLSLYSSTVLASYYMGQLVAFCRMPSEVGLRKEQFQGMMAHLVNIGWKGKVVCCDCLHTTKEVRQAYLDSTQYLDTVLQIFPNRVGFKYEDIRFANLCKQTLESTGDNSDQYVTLLQKLRLQSGIGEDLLETLCVYLLDTGANIAKTAKCLFVHTNTVKYRLKIVCELTGIAPDTMPEALPLYLVAALHRIISSNA